MLRGAKVIYFICNELNVKDIEALLVPLGLISTGTLKYEKASKALGYKQSKWQHSIITSFIFPLVGRLITEWADNPDNAGKSFEDLTPPERWAVWKAEYLKDAATMAKEMWTPVKSVIDWHALFEATGLPAETSTKIKRTREMILIKFLFACDQVYLHRYNVENAVKVR